MIAYMKKEVTEYIRTGRLVILGLIFMFFGILAPATAKLTPWLMEQLSDDMEKSGFIVGEIKVNALSSWEQFFSNASMMLIVFVLIVGGTFASEYKSGAFIFTVTRGLSREKVVLAKAVMLAGLWTVMYAICAGLTYFYTVYYWENEGVTDTFAALALMWVFGLWLVCLFMLMATMFTSVSGALGGTAAAVFAVYLVGMAPKVADYLPTRLMGGMSLLSGEKVPADYTSALIVAIVTGVLMIAGSVLVFRKKQL